MTVPTPHSLLLALVLTLLLPACDGQRRVEPSIELWDAWLDSPGGRLDFGLELSRDGSQAFATLVNGTERIEVPQAEWDGQALTLGMVHYDSAIHATMTDGRLDGGWERASQLGTTTRMDFHATRRSGLESTSGSDRGLRPLAERWRVHFSLTDDPAVGVFEWRDDGAVRGTFLTTTGDYRFLAGSLDDDTLRLSTFDGAHAFLFEATFDESGGLSGDFWSRDTWHETWRAQPDPEASLPDAFTLTRWISDTPLSEIRYPDLDGNLRALSDEVFAGVRLIELFGSWCPNCNDATQYLVELDATYRQDGLTVIGLAFEMSGDPVRDREQLRIYADYHGLDYPLLLAGTTDKDDASRQFPHIDRVRAYPTFLFVDSDDQIRAVYSGFSGLATGEAHRELRRQFSGWIDTLLEEGA